MKKLNQEAFTIVELMIATTVLSVILLITTVSMMGIGNLYYKGFNQARIQNNVRTITDSISQDLKYNGIDPVTDDGTHAPVRAYCVGTSRYTYVLRAQIGHQIGGSGPVYQHVLWRDKINGGACTTADLTLANPGGLEGMEMIATNSRLFQFAINPLTSPYKMQVGVAYGDDDLYEDINATPMVCKGGVAGRFCSTSALTTIVTRRQW